MPFACIVAPEPTNISPLKVDIPPTFKAPDVLFCVPIVATPVTVKSVAPIPPRSPAPTPI